MATTKKPRPKLNTRKRKPGTRSHAKKNVTADTPLTPTEQRFVDEYLVDFKGAFAYRRVHPHVTKGSARALAVGMLSRLNVRRAVKAGRRRLRRDAHVEALTLILELRRLALSDMGDILTLNGDGSVTLRPNIPPDARRAIKSIEVKEPVTVGTGKKQKTYQPVKVVLYDKLTAMEKLAKHLGLYDPPAPVDALLNALPPRLQAPVRAAISAALHGTTVEGGGHDNGRADLDDRRGTEAQSAAPVPGDEVATGPLAIAPPDEPAEANGSSVLSAGGESPFDHHADSDNLGPLFDD